jgi:bifunctional UDP-N-acetylglucosamine pyrophosphorylase/glucosamine-1-phosphate N-acetyltransferase
MPSKKITDAVILAAGRGERLWPYGDTNAKAALSVGARPLIQYQLDALAGAGVKSVTVVVGYLDGMVRNACATWLQSRGPKLDIAFVAFPQSKGTAQSACMGLSSRSNPKAPAYLIPGDLYFAASDFQKVADAWTGKGAAALVAPADPATSQEGFVAQVKRGKVESVLAHSRCRDSETRVYTGVVAVPEGFVDIVGATPEIPTCVEIGAMPPVAYEVLESVHQYLRSGGMVSAVEAKDSVIDIDKPWDLLEANMLATQHQAGSLKKNSLAKGASIDPTARIEGPVKLGEGSKIGPGVIVYGNLVVGKNSEITDGAYIENNVIVGDNCKIWRGALIGKATVIGHRCVVGHGAEIEGVMMDESYSYHYGEYWGILGKCADLGAATVCGTLRFDDGPTAHRVKGRKEIPRYNSNATYLGDFVRTGVGAILMPGVKVGSYSLIGAGVLLSGDVPNNTSVYLEQDLKRGSWGPERYGW